jgi:glycerol transport system ATP-binding protein
MSLHQPDGKSMKLDCTISTTEITGSESFIHLQSKGIHMVALMHGVHRIGIGDEIPAYLDQDHLFVFDRNENLVSAPGFECQN